MNAEVPSVTTEELVQMIQRWVKRDEDEESDEPMTKQEMVERCVIAIAARPPKAEISEDMIRQIIYQNAPNAPVGVVKDEDDEPSNNVVQMPPKPERKFTPDDYAKAGGRFDASHSMWFVNRCYGCGEFGKDKCCGNVCQVSMVMSDGRITACGRQALGLDPIRRPQRPDTNITKKAEHQDWMFQFSGYDDLEDGGIKMYIENLIPEGVTIISSLPKEGKTWLALSIAKAFTSGQPLFGRKGYEVPEPVPVLYMAAEVGDRALKGRIRKFGITNDRSKFLCRTFADSC